jgi:hypothetical protein
VGRSGTLTGWCTQMEMLIGGTWQPARSDRTEDVTSPFDGTGLKASGIGKEGPRSAAAEMTDTKTVILHGRPW